MKKVPHFGALFILNVTVALALPKSAYLADILNVYSSPSINEPSENEMYGKVNGVKILEEAIARPEVYSHTY